VSAYLDLPAGNAALKEYYDGQKVDNLAYEENAGLALFVKDTEAGGKYIPIPVMYEVNQGRSATFSNAQGNQTPIQLAEFLLTRKSDYDVATIDNQTMEAASSDKGSFMRFSTELIDAAIQGASISAASALFRDGTGTIGTIATGGITSGVITLSNAADVSQFGLNQTLQANSTSGGTPRAALGYVIARNVMSGTITVASSGLGGSAASPTSWAAGDSLLVQGDNNAKISGLPAWLPTTAPTSSDNFFGVNRSVDSRLYGLSYDGSAQTIEEAVVDHTMILAREGSSPDHFMTNFGTYAALVKALGSKVQYVELKGPADIAFEGVSIHGARSKIKVVADRSCQVQRGFMLKMNTWKLYSLGQVPKILRYGDNLDMLRVYNADAGEVRVAYYANLGCKAPGKNGQIILSA
jgi:hypothetical protein